MKITFNKVIKSEGNFDIISGRGYDEQTILQGLKNHTLQIEMFSTTDSDSLAIRTVPEDNEFGEKNQKTIAICSESQQVITDINYGF